jgi:multidrug resistance efflux pump
MTARRKLRLALILVVVLATVVGVSFAWQSVSGAPTRDFPTVRVQRGNIEQKVYTAGELRPAKSATLMAPPVSGTLQIVTLRKTGERVNAGDVVIEFDPSEQEYNLEQARSELLQAEQEITKMKADSAVQTAQDKVALLQAKFTVRRAELDVSRNELVSAIDGKKNLLNLDEAKRKLAQLEHDAQSRLATQQAGLTVVEERRNKTRLNMQVAQSNIDNMTLKSPISGLIALKENPDASGGFFFTGMTLPEFRAGDLVFPGRPIVDVLEVEQMEILGKVSENDRGNIKPGQPVEVRVDALPGQLLSGKVKTVAGMASRGGWFGSSGAERKFDATFELDKLTAEIRPGVTAQVIIVGDQLRDALFLPRQAIFEKEGKPIAYVRGRDGFAPHDVKVLHRTESQVAIEGLQVGDEVALVNPEARGKGKSGAASAAPAGGPSLKVGGAK